MSLMLGGLHDPCNEPNSPSAYPLASATIKQHQAHTGAASDTGQTAQPTCPKNLRCSSVYTRDSCQLPMCCSSNPTHSLLHSRRPAAGGCLAPAAAAGPAACAAARRFSCCSLSSLSPSLLTVSSSEFTSGSTSSVSADKMQSCGKAGKQTSDIIEHYSKHLAAQEHRAKSNLCGYLSRPTSTCQAQHHCTTAERKSIPNCCCN
jgi:hypothetical protein